VYVVVAGSTGTIFDTEAAADAYCLTPPGDGLGGKEMSRAALYLRVSTTEQTTDNQERELLEVAARMGHEIVGVYRGPRDLWLSLP
jgi:Resolvase, N terminal domain